MATHPIGRTTIQRTNAVNSAHPDDLCGNQQCARDYFFQYSWILPGIFDPKVNLREHRYFGCYGKSDANFLFDFWDNARKGRGAALQQYCEPGLYSDREVKAPLAAYRHDRKYYDTVGSLLIQHGSYQWISREDQPHIEDGGLRHGTWLGDEMATQAGFDIESPGFARNLWQAAQQSYSLDPMIGVQKFGPHHVVLKTSLSNIRLTTFFAGESEVKIIDPSRVSHVEAVGCKVEVIPLLHSSAP
jgi:hypothetical protein